MEFTLQIMTKSLVIQSLFAAFALLNMPGVSYSQEWSKGDASTKEEVEEKMLQWKKVRLLDILQLEPSLADKFLLQYNAKKKVIGEKKKAHEQAAIELREALERGEEPEAKVENLLRKSDEFHASIRDYMTSFSSLLPPEKYARLILFEQTFFDEMMKSRRKDKKMRKGSEKR